MSSLVVSGDTSGSVTLQAPAVSGSTVLTLPATSGTVITTTSGTASSATTATTATNIASGSNGTIPYQSASGTTQMLAVGTAGQLLQTNGVGAPSWATPSSGAMVFLSTITATASSTVDVETTFDSTYDAYALVITDMRTSTSADIRARLKINGTYRTTGYDYHCVKVNSTTTAYTADAGTSFAYITFSGASMNPPSYPESTSNYVLYTHNPTSTSRYKNIYWSGFLTNNSANLVYNHGAGSYMADTPAMTGIRFYGSTGTLSGTFRLYGIKNS